MPDHLHLLWIGLASSSDQRKAAKFFREQVNRLLKNTGHKLQLQAYDHVLTVEERHRDAFARVAFYIFDNPVRKGLVKRWQDYAFTDSTVAGYPALDVREPGYWEKFWKIFQGLVEPERKGG